MHSRNLSGWRGHNGLELDRGQPLEGGLSPASVAGPLDPGDDRGERFLASGPGLTFEDVLLEQAEEARHGGVVPGSTDSAHRSDHGMPGQGTHVLPASKLRPPISMQHATCDVTAPGDGVVQCVDRDA